MPAINLSLNRSQSVAQIQRITAENRRQRSVTISEEPKFYYDEDNDITLGTTIVPLLFLFSQAKATSANRQGGKK